MKIVELKNERLLRRYEVLVERSLIEGKVLEQIEDYAKNASVSGFRTGSVPIDMLMSRYGDVLRKDVMNEYVSEILREIASTYSIPGIASEPRVDIATTDENVVRYTIDFEIRPEVPSINLETVSITVNKVEISEKDIESVVNETFNNENVKWEPVNREVQVGDRVLIKYTNSVGKKPIERNKESYLKIGEVEKFDKYLIGKKINEKVSFEYEYKEGKKLNYEVEILEISNASKYEILNDDFAKSKGYNDVAQFSESVKKLLELRAEELFANNKVVAIRNALMDCLPDLQVPEYFIALESMMLIQSLSKGASSIPGIEYCKTDEERKAFVTEFALTNIRVGLILKKVGEDLGVQVTEKEIRKALEKQHLPITQDNGQRMEADLFEEKVFDKIESIIKIEINKMSLSEYERHSKISS